MRELVFVIKRSDHKYSTICILGGELVSSYCIEFLKELIVEVWPPQASVLACVVLTGTSEGLAGPRVLEGTRCRCAAPSDL